MALCGFQLGGFNLGAGSALPNRARLLLNKVPGASALYMPDRKLSSRIINGVRTLRTSNNDEQDFSPAQIGRGELRDFTLSADPQVLEFANAGVSGSPADKKRMYFDGVDDYVSLGSGDPFSFNGSSRIDIEATFYYDGTTPAVNYSIFNSSINLNATGVSLVISGLNSVRVAGRSQFSDSFQSHTATIAQGLNTVRGYLDFSNNTLGLSVNGGAFTEVSATFGSSQYVFGVSTAQSTIGFLPAVANTQFRGGFISDVIIYKDETATNQWNGYGNTNADWEDQIGSNNGTVNGSPELFTGQSFNGRTPINYDWSGNGRNETQTTIANQPFIATGGVLEDGLRFNGTTWLRSDVASAILKPAEVTYIGWLRPTSTGTGRAIFSNRTAATNGVTIWQRDAGTTMAFDFADGTSAEQWDTGYELLVDTWTHIALTRDANGRKLFVNGVLEADTTDAGGTTAGGTFGTWGGREGAGNYVGRRKSWGIYPRVLTLKEINTVKTLTDPTA